jgi:hypothetical protein
VLVPAIVPHAFRNVGETRARIVGFFSSNPVVAITDDIVQPVGSRVIGSPPPDVVGRSNVSRPLRLNPLEDRSLNWP